MRVDIDFLCTEQASAALHPLRSTVQPMLEARLSKCVLGNKLAALGLTALFVDVNKGTMPNEVRYRRTERSIMSSANGDHDALLESDSTTRVALLLDALRAAILQIPQTHLSTAETNCLVETLESAGRELFADHLGNDHNVARRSGAHVLSVRELPHVIVLQWRWQDVSEERAGVASKVAEIEDLIERETQLAVDGHDVGGSVINVFLHCEEEFESRNAVLSLVDKNLFPPGVRIAVETPEGYMPVYPPTLTKFDIGFDHDEAQ